MSICRFSSDNWKSDVYIYESECGIELHIASSRIISDIPKLPPLSEYKNDLSTWVSLHEKQMEAVRSAKREIIGGKYDGRSLTLDNASELYYALKKVQDYGYHVPDFVFDIIREKINQEDDPML